VSIPRRTRSGSGSRWDRCTACAIAVGIVADPHQHALWIPATDGAIRIDTRTGTADRRALAPKTHLGEISGMGPPSDPLAMIA
jgi:hypothetical protein